MNSKGQETKVEMGESVIYVDASAEASYRRKVDIWVLPVLWLVRDFSYWLRICDH